MVETLLWYLSPVNTLKLWVGKLGPLNYRTMKIGKELQDDQIQPSIQYHHIHQTIPTNATSACFLNTSRDGGSTPSLGNLFQCSTTSWVNAHMFEVNLGFIFISPGHFPKENSSSSNLPSQHWNGGSPGEGFTSLWNKTRERNDTRENSQIPEDSSSAFRAWFDLGTWVVWIERKLQNHPAPKPLPWTRTNFTRPGCSKPGHEHFQRWRSHSFRASAPSHGGISS